MKFAEKLRAARLKMGYTQTQLAEMAHVSLRTIINYEKGDVYQIGRASCRERV